MQVPGACMQGDMGRTPALSNASDDLQRCHAEVEGPNKVQVRGGALGPRWLTPGEDPNPRCTCAATWTDLDGQAHSVLMVFGVPRWVPAKAVKRDKAPACRRVRCNRVHVL